MTTSGKEFSDTSAAVRRRFLLAVASAALPLRARELVVPGLDRRSVQKRLERLRQAADDRQAGDEAVVALARRELDRLALPPDRGMQLLRSLASAQAQEFLEEAGLQNLAIGDWVELAHSPGDRGWSHEQVAVRRLSSRSVLGRGRNQGWLEEKKAYLRQAHTETRLQPELRRDLVPNLLKMDLVALRFPGTEDSPTCALDIAPIDWQTCLALNGRLDAMALTASGTVRQRWGQPAKVLERRALPGMLVGHVVVLTTDQRLLVCLRQASLKDEADHWSISFEERWSTADSSPHELVKRGLREELGVEVKESAIRVLSWGIEASVLYPGFIALAEVDLASWQIERSRSHAGDANEIRYVASIPAGEAALPYLLSDDYAPEAEAGLRRPWHRTAKARLFAALAYRATARNQDGRSGVLAILGHMRSS